MMKSYEVERKIDEINKRIESLGHSENEELYKAHLESLRNSYLKEFIKSMQRKEPEIGGKTYGEPKLLGYNVIGSERSTGFQWV